MEEDRLAAAANFVNRFPGVTHNYQREGKYQLWFTLLTLGAAEKQAVLSALAGTDGVNDIMELPSEKAYKIRVALPWKKPEEIQLFCRRNLPGRTWEKPTLWLSWTAWIGS